MFKSLLSIMALLAKEASRKAPGYVGRGHIHEDLEYAEKVMSGGNRDSSLILGISVVASSCATRRQAFRVARALSRCFIQRHVSLRRTDPFVSHGMCPGVAGRHVIFSHKKPNFLASQKQTLCWVFEPQKRNVIPANPTHSKSDQFNNIPRSYHVVIDAHTFGFPS